MKLAVPLYKCLLLAYPAALRRELGPGMVRTFEDRFRRSRSVSLVLEESFDVLSTGLWARLEQPRARKRLHGGTRVEILVKDLRHAARTLLRSPGFAVVVVASLALGIGANTAVFSLVNAVLLKPMPVDRPEELVAVYATRVDESMPLNLSYPNYRDLGASGIFADLVGFQGANLSLQADGAEPEIVWSELVTENYFSGLRVRAALGRTFLPEDADRPVAVLSHDFWRRKFGARESVLGSTARFNGHEFEIVGVAAAGFTGAKFLGFTPDVWVPVTVHEIVWPGSEGRLERRQGAWLNVRGRVEPGVGLEQVRSALATAAARLESEYPDANRDWRLHAIEAPRKTEPFVAVQLGTLLPATSTVLLAVVLIVLLIACANVASLKLARALARRRELAVRLSLGASRFRLVRQLALESLVLAAVAGLLGLWLGHLLLDAAMGLNPVLDFSVDYGVELDWRVLSFTAVTTLLAALLSGILPALHVARGDVTPSLKERAGGERRRAWRLFIVVPQVALSLVALVAAGLLVRSFRNAASVSPGFATEGLVLASVNLALQGYDEARGRAFYRSLRERVEALPGVEAVSLAFPLPLDAYTEADRIFPEGAGGSPDDEGTIVFFSTVGEGYFETIGTPLLDGRPFTEQDDERVPPVAVVNETLARRFWPGDSAVGKRFDRGRPGELVEVVGVVPDGKYVTIGEEPRPYFFVPLQQNHTAPMTVVTRTRLPLNGLEPGFRGAVRALNPMLPVYGVKTMEDFLSRSLAGPRALALSVSLFAALAGALATVGVYGLMSYSVSQKRHELGIRMALGATNGDVLALFLKQAGRVVFAGVLVGLALAWASTRVLSSLLIGVEATSLVVFGGGAVLLALVALAGSFLPSRRATKLDPLTTLRHE